MSFTPTHILAVVPIAALRPRALPFSALVIGSVVPDWPLYYAIGPSYSLTHSFLGLMTTCLPIGLLLWMYYLVLLRPAVLPMLPARLLRFATPPVQIASWRYYAAGAVAIFVGATTHVVWDAFTHGGAWGVELLPVLGIAVMHIGQEPIYGYSLLQQGSSLIGLPLLGYLAYRATNVDDTTAVGFASATLRARRLFWAGLSAVPFVGGMLASQPWTVRQLSLTAVYDMLYLFVTVGLAMMGAMLMGYSILYFVHRRWRKIPISSA